MADGAGDGDASPDSDRWPMQGRSEFRLPDARASHAVEHHGAGGAELQLASNQTGDDAARVGDVLLAKPHDIRCAGRLILLGLGECGERGSDRQDENECSRFSHGVALLDQFSYERDSGFRDHVFMQV